MLFVVVGVSGGGARRQVAVVTPCDVAVTLNGSDQVRVIAAEPQAPRLCVQCCLQVAVGEEVAAHDVDRLYFDDWPVGCGA